MSVNQFPVLLKTSAMLEGKNSFTSFIERQKLARLKPPRQILILHNTTEHGRFILQEGISMLNAQAPCTLFCSLSYHLVS